MERFLPYNMQSELSFMLSIYVSVPYKLISFLTILPLVEVLGPGGGSSARQALTIVYRPIRNSP